MRGCRSVCAGKRQHSGAWAAQRLWRWRQLMPQQCSRRRRSTSTSSPPPPRLPSFHASRAALQAARAQQQQQQQQQQPRPASSLGASLATGRHRRQSRRWPSLSSFSSGRAGCSSRRAPSSPVCASRRQPATLRQRPAAVRKAGAAAAAAHRSACQPSSGSWRTPCSRPHSLRVRTGALGAGVRSMPWDRRRLVSVTS